MFARLRHHALVGGNDECQEIDAVCPGQHVFDETLVARNIDEADFQVIEFEIGKTEVNGNAATFFFGKSIGIGAGEGADESALAVVYVTRRANNQ
jgi:hypothetical protein